MAAKTINSRQLRSLYWPRWRDAEKVLMANGAHSKAEADEIRKDIHRAVTGRECSSKELTNRQLDEVLAKFMAIAQPRNGAAQARQAAQPCTRALYNIEQIRKALGLTENYVDSMARRIVKRPLAHCDESGLQKVLIALTKHAKRNAHQ